MKFFDLHCDTITECYNQNKSLTNNDLDISLDRGKILEKWTQVFAIWLPDTIRGNEAETYYEKVLAKYKEEIKNAENVNPVLAVEGGAVLNGKLENIEKLHNDGVKILTLTWNGENEIASGCFAEEDKGLTSFGKEAVKELTKRNIIPDVSHLAEKSFYDLCEETDFPFVASHSDAFSLNPHVRNLKDEQIKVIVERKGLIGLNFYNKFLGEGNAIEMLIKHAEHILNLGGEDVLCMGSDFDGCSIDEELKGIEKMENLYSVFNKHFGEQLTDKIFYENANAYLLNK
ncbi:MAG: membrane dipeptidase [Clostridia bacterium]|nr:membrane dipeptidase [Clostridia bacterium]